MERGVVARGEVRNVGHECLIIETPPRYAQSGAPVRNAISINAWGYHIVSQVP